MTEDGNESGRGKANHESLWVRTCVRAHIGTHVRCNVETRVCPRNRSGTVPNSGRKENSEKTYVRNYFETHVGTYNVGTSVGTYVGKDVKTGACRRNPSEPSLGTNVTTVLCWRSYSHSTKPFPFHVGKQMWQMWLSTRLAGYQTLCNNQNCKRGAPDTIRWQNCADLKQFPSSKRMHGRPNE